MTIICSRTEWIAIVKRIRLKLGFTYEFNRIPFVFEKDTRHQRLVKGNPFVCNAKILFIQNK